MRKRRALLAELGLPDLDPTRLVKSLGVGQQQLVEIAAGISRRCQVLILDEPTAALTSVEIERLFTQIQKLKTAGVGVIYVSHRLEEIKRIADRITILRDGKIIATRPVREVTTPQIVSWMVGRELGEARRRTKNKDGSVALRVEGLSAGSAVRDVHFEVRRGEILGFAGLMGSGTHETVRAVFGADRADSGKVFVQGSPLAGPHSVSARRRPLWDCAPDRRSKDPGIDSASSHPRQRNADAIGEP